MKKCKGSSNIHCSKYVLAFNNCFVFSFALSFTLSSTLLAVLHCFRNCFISSPVLLRTFFIFWFRMVLVFQCKQYYLWIHIVAGLWSNLKFKRGIWIFFFYLVSMQKYIMPQLAAVSVMISVISSYKKTMIYKDVVFIKHHCKWKCPTAFE